VRVFCFVAFEPWAFCVVLLDSCKAGRTKGGGMRLLLNCYRFLYLAGWLGWLLWIETMHLMAMSLQLVRKLKTSNHFSMPPQGWLSAYPSRNI